MQTDKMVTFLIYAIVIIFFSGCAAERTVVGNSFQSSYPKLNIPIDQNFAYLGKINDLKSNLDYYGERELRSEHEYHIFVPKGKEVRINKLVSIRIGKTETSYIDTSPDNKANLDFNVVQLYGDNYKYYIRLFPFSTAHKAIKHVMDSGYVLPTCVIADTFYYFAYRNVIVDITYFEDASLSGMSCRDRKKYSRDTLSDRQKNYLADLHKRALAVIAGGVAEKSQQQTSK